MGENSFVPKEELAPLSQEDKRQIGIRNRRKKTLFFLTEYLLFQVRGWGRVLRVSGDQVVSGVRRGETIWNRSREEQENELT